ncbi:type I-C CRISPR-associated protein Cas8c/Csd1 [uncultured Pseudoflavonifractor sp.]|uniref:type I-C CRISPR-associated protein Cas8c/Csd1 n=1 Tax=uncultured Pseudoflavonifractor sp. TaxID=1221379 RepID=UPI0025F033F7|nr:type I-C CRISPR-associated protein Cas8c/Csd1 [uncultured Pseudoflavonifractor sp.]
MGWLDRCYQTYEKNLSQVGKPSASLRFGWDAPMLLPVAHTTQKVNVEVSLSPGGTFLSARVLRSDEMTTVIPCTEASAARTSGPVPHPLADKLRYVAGDYAAYGGAKKPMWTEYLAQLQAWCDSPFGVDGIRAVLAYLRQGCLVRDLVSFHILLADDGGRLLKKWTGPKEDMPPIFQSVTGGDQSEAFVRFQVGGDDLSSDPAVWDCYTRYYLSTLKDTGFCYVQGREMPVSLLSPYKIRSAGDRAKLISSNDSTNFTFRGRFETAGEALSIGYETTQKAHSALRWLVGRQGIQNGDQAILVWGTENEPIPPVTGDACDIVQSSRSDLDDDDLGSPLDAAADLPRTREAFAAAFQKAIRGYRRALPEHSQVSVMVLDSATPGRLSIRYYRELQGSRLMDHIADWHRSFAWALHYRKLQTRENGKKVLLPLVFEGAPAPADIAAAAYGAKADEKLRQQTVERLLPCITEGRPFPRDIMLSAVRRASHGIAMEPWEASKTRSIACALVRGYHHRNLKEEYTMALDETCSDRSYLFGRILACGEQLEQYAVYNTSGDRSSRPTNALRYEVAFTQHPARTLALLRKQLEPYLERLIKARKSTYAGDLMLQLIARIPADQFNDQPLTELYLLGYACQRAEFFKKADTVPDADE